MQLGTQIEERILNHYIHKLIGPTPLTTSLYPSLFTQTRLETWAVRTQVGRALEAFIGCL